MSIHTALNILLLLAALSNGAIGAIVFARNSSLRINRLFFLFSLGVAGWAGTNVLFQTTTHSHLKYIIGGLFSYGFAGVMSLMFFFFSESIVGNTRRSKPNPWRTLLIWYTSIVAILSVIPGVVATGVVDSSIVTHVPMLVLYGIGVLLTLASSLWMLLRSLHQLHGQERSRVQVVLLSFSIALVIGVVCNLVLPLYGVYKYVGIGPLGSLIFLSGTAYSIVKNKLFDIRAVLARAVAYAILLALLAVFYTVIMFGSIRYVFNVDLSANVQAVIAVATTLVALSFHRVKRFFDKITNEVFYQDAYDPQKLFNDFNRVLVAKTELEDLIEGSLKVVDQYLKSSATLIAIETGNEVRIMGTQNWHIDTRRLHDPLRHYLAQHDMVVADFLSQGESKIAAQLSKLNVSLIVRLNVSDANSQSYLGLLAFKPKRSGSPYNDQDIKAIRAIADGLAIAVQNALRFQEIEEFNKTLQQKVDDKTRSLQHANDKLRKMDQTKDDFISMASHQLRTPLTSVKGYVSMVLDGDVGDLNRKQRDYLNQVFVSSQRMSYLISDLLNVSRLRTGKFIIDRNQCNLANVIHEEVSQLIETAKARDLKLIYHPPEHFPSLMLDEMKMRQVIMNFIDNAIYYTPSGGSITVTLADNPQSIEFTVTDTGIGVPRSEQHHLFSKFFRAQNARVARPDGTGLGLFMAKKVVTVQGGAIIFKSREGKGSTFGFTMPKTVVGMNDAGPKKVILHS